MPELLHARTERIESLEEEPLLGYHKLCCQNSRKSRRPQEKQRKLFET